MANFWSDAQQQDPKRQYRWIMRIASIPAYVLKTVNKPGFTVSETEHKYLNHTYWYPGRVTWDPITLTLADPVSPDMAATMAQILASSGYSPAQNQTQLATISKAQAVAALGNQIEIQQIDADGKAVETWKLVNPFITEVKFGDLDYTGDEMSQIDITNRYDWAELITANGDATKGQKQFFKLGAPDAE